MSAVHEPAVTKMGISADASARWRTAELIEVRTTGALLPVHARDGERSDVDLDRCSRLAFRERSRRLRTGSLGSGAWACRASCRTYFSLTRVILVRSVVGGRLSQALLTRAELATTDEAREAERVLHHKFDLSEADAAREMDAALLRDIYRTPSYRQAAAGARILTRTPILFALAATISHGGAIRMIALWNRRPTWTTRNRPAA